MDIGEYVTVSAENATGAYWATRSILQIAELNDGTMPYGITKDYPKYEVRGFMLDVARKPVIYGDSSGHFQRDGLLQDE